MTWWRYKLPIASNWNYLHWAGWCLTTPRPEKWLRSTRATRASGVVLLSARRARRPIWRGYFALAESTRFNCEPINRMGPHWPDFLKPGKEGDCTDRRG